MSALKKPEYQGYTVKIFYLLDKAHPDKNTIAEIKSNFNVNLIDCLHDYTYLMRDIENLETNKIIELNKKYFKGISEKYTDEIILNLICKKLIRENKHIKSRYNDNFVSIDVNEKITINRVNSRIAAWIKIGLDYSKIIESIDEDNNLLTDLRVLIIDDFYKQILIDSLKSKISKNKLDDKSANELHNLANEHNIDFNDIISSLHETIERHIEIKDFNPMNIAWIIIAYFFEICDIGVHQL